MIQDISTATPPINQDNLSILPRDPITVSDGEQIEQQAPLASEKTNPGDFLFKALEQLAAGRKFSSKKSLKAFASLGQSLEKAFSAATKVDHKTGEEEIKQGGLRRVGKDLNKLFKGMGLPPQLAKQFSRGITGAMRQEDVEQINFSLTTSRSLNIEAYQLQEGYLADGDGTTIAASIANSFQLSAVQVRSFDVSINLRTGEYSLNHSQSNSVSINTSSTAVLASSAPALQASEEEVQSAPVEAPAEPTDDIATLVRSDSSLLQISRTVQLSALMETQPATVVNASTPLKEEVDSDGLSRLQQLIEKLEEVTAEAKDLFESLTQIHDLRIEKENDDDHLRFSVDALAPIGLTATDDTGHATTLYPRPDGSLGKVAENTVKVVA